MANEIIRILNEVSVEAGALAPEKNGGVPFSFRGVDATVAHLAPALKKHGVVIIPEVLDRVTSTRELASGKAITQSDLLVKYTFYAPDGSSVSATTAGLAQDFADRSAAQAASVSFRVALLQVFKLPTTDKEPEQAGEDTQKFIADNAKANAAPKAGAKRARTAVDARNDVQAVIAGDNAYGPGEINALGKKLSDGKEPQEWMQDVKVLDAILEAVKNGEVA